MGKQSIGSSLQDIMPDLLLNLEDARDVKSGMGLKDLLKDAEKSLKEEEGGVGDVERFVLSIVRQVSKDTGIPSKDVLGISKQDLEVLYSLAWNLYEHGKYEESFHMFRLMIMMDHFEFKFLFGLAACMHMMEQYFSAATAYMIASTLNPRHVWSHFHAAECYLKLHDPISASVSLGLAIEASQGEKGLDALRERCSIAREKLIRKVREMRRKKEEEEI